MRKHLIIGLLLVLVIAMLVGATTANAKPGIYCRCDFIDGKWYKCCPDPDLGYVVCKPGCRRLN